MGQSGAVDYDDREDQSGAEGFGDRDDQSGAVDYDDREDQSGAVGCDGTEAESCGAKNGMCSVQGKKATLPSTFQRNTKLCIRAASLFWDELNAFEVSQSFGQPIRGYLGIDNGRSSQRFKLEQANMLVALHTYKLSV
eukprot:1160533-Pelagomonas_calceolata.AAC.4